MQHSDGGEYWETVVEGLAVERWTAVVSGTTLVRLRLTNDGESERLVHVIEDVPDAATNASLITTTGDKSDSWRYDSDCVRHEFLVPPGRRRTSAYFLRSEESPPLSLDPPSIEHVDGTPDRLPSERGNDTDRPEDRTEPLVESLAPTDTPPDAPVRLPPARFESTEEPADDSSESESMDRESIDTESTVSESTDDESEETESTAGEPTDSQRDENATSDGGGIVACESDTDVDACPTTEESTNMKEYKLPRRTEEQSSDDGDTVVDDLLDALEDASPATRRALRNELGANERERARLEYVQSRLDDLAAYIDALEMLVDEEGIDVVDELQSAIDDNASKAEIIEDDLATVEASIDRRRAAVDESMEGIERDIEAVQAAFDERLSGLESDLESTQSALSSLKEAVESDRQARAREVRRFDQSLSEVEAALDRLETTVSEGEAFRRRFTDVFTSEPERAGEDPGRAERVEPDSASPSR